MLIALASVKGSPGVTTFAVAFAARWPGPPPILVEADPAGGDLAARFGLAQTPGLLSLAAAARGTTEPDIVSRHTQRLPGGLEVAPGPVGSDQARAALRALCPAGGAVDAASGADRVVIADCGRLDVDSPANPLVAVADQLLLVVRPRRDELAHLAARLDQIRQGPRRTGILLAGDGYPSAEVAAELDVPVLGRIPRDPRTAARLSGVPVRARLSRRRLPRTAADIAAAVAAGLARDRPDHPLAHISGEDRAAAPTSAGLAAATGGASR